MAAVAEAAFVLLVGVAMARYPGGTPWDRATVGHSFFGNFFSDLLRDRAFNGQPNPGAGVACVGMAALVPVLAAGWWMAAYLLSPMRRAARLVLLLGAISLVATAAVPFSPSDQLPRFHALVVLTAGWAGLAALTVSVLGMWRGGHRGVAAAGGGVLLVGCVNAALYADHALSGTPVTALLPAAQKTATLLVVAWLSGMMVATWRVARRPLSPGAGPPPGAPPQGQREDPT
jgi:hypothetical protein